MKTLLILRHSKAADASRSGADRDRPLSDRGERDAAAMGKALRKLELNPRHVLCSPAVRTRQTAEIFLDKLRFEGPVDFPEEGYLASADTLLSLIRRQDSKQPLLLIGHNPGLEELVGILTAGHPTLTPLPTSALVRIDFDIEKWSELTEQTGQLVWLLTPDVVEKL